MVVLWLCYVSPSGEWINKSAKIDWYVNNQQPIAAQYFGLYADPSDIGKNASGDRLSNLSTLSRVVTSRRRRKAPVYHSSLVSYANMTRRWIANVRGAIVTRPCNVERWSSSLSLMTFTCMHTKLRSHRGTARRATSVEILSTAAQLDEKWHLKWPPNGTQCHRKWRNSIGHISLAINDLQYQCRWRGGAAGRALDLRSSGRGFKAYLGQNCVRPRPHQKQCRSNRRHCRSYVRLCRSNIRFVAINCNNVERFCCKIPSFRQYRNKLNMFNLIRLCRKDEILFDIVTETTATMSKQHSTLSIEWFNL